MKSTDSNRFHPQYRELHAELLARPFPVVSGRVMVSHRAILFSSGEAAEHRAAVSALAENIGRNATPDTQGHQLVSLDGAELRIERHTEFTTFSVFAPQDGEPFSKSAIDFLPDGWLDGIPGHVMAAVEIASESVAAEVAGTPDAMRRTMEIFGGERIIGSQMAEGVLSAWSHFQVDERGATRFLVQVHQQTTGRYGRLLQRLMEIENYRLAAMLSLPLARELIPQVEALELQHVSLVERIGVMNDGDERELLGNLTNLSLATERLQAHCGTRFDLTDSYARILSARLAELHEKQVPGYQTLGEFFDRRLAQAWHSCESAEAGLTALSARLESTTGLLRTRVDVNLQSQNHLLLASVDRRAAAQLKLQHNVEGLSVVVLTYYLANLIKLLLEGTKAAGAHFSSSLVTAGLLPLLAYGVWRAVRRARDGGH